MCYDLSFLILEVLALENSVPELEGLDSEITVWLVKHT